MSNDKDSGGTIHCPLHGDGMDPDPQVESRRYAQCSICKSQASMYHPAVRAVIRRLMKEWHGLSDEELERRGLGVLTVTDWANSAENARSE